MASSDPLLATSVLEDDEHVHFTPRFLAFHRTLTVHGRAILIFWIAMFLLCATQVLFLPLPPIIFYSDTSYH